MKKYILILMLTICTQGLFALTSNADSIKSDTQKVVVHQDFPVMIDFTSEDEATKALINLDIEGAEAVLKREIAQAKRKRESTAYWDKLMSSCQKTLGGLKGTDRVVIVDSIVVDKKSFLSAYPLTEEYGTLSQSENGETVMFQTQINGMVLKPDHTRDSLNNINIYKYFLENGKLMEKDVVKGLGVNGDINYPYLMPDGQMFYFAARSEDGYGNYDLYVTRYDSDSKRFYRAENMGYPYNSYANDYMLVINDDANIGWFASDRYQPINKVCIYTFIPNTSRHTIDFENTPKNEVVCAASLRPINSLVLTDEQRQDKISAKAKVRGLKETVSHHASKDFEFIVNDNLVYHSLDDFKSNDSKSLCADWIQKKKNLQSLCDQLLKLRDNNADALKNQILNLESRIQELQNEIHDSEKAIRRLEVNN